ncbi:MAG: hypothetical protein ABID64_00180 [Nitrospirota bacterium]
MTEEEAKEWDNALLDLVNKGLIEYVENGGESGFRIKNCVKFSRQ